MNTSRQNTRQKTPKTTRPPCTHVLRTQPVLGAGNAHPDPKTLSISRHFRRGRTHPPRCVRRSLVSSPGSVGRFLRGRPVVIHMVRRRRLSRVGLRRRSTGSMCRTTILLQSMNRSLHSFLSHPGLLVGLQLFPEVSLSLAVKLFREV